MIKSKMIDLTLLFKNNIFYLLHIHSINFYFVFFPWVPFNLLSLGVVFDSDFKKESKKYLDVK